MESTVLMPPVSQPRRLRSVCWTEIGLVADPRVALRRRNGYRLRSKTRQVAASLTVSFNGDLREEVDAAAQRYGVSRSLVVRKALELWLAEYGKAAER